MQMQIDAASCPFVHVVGPDVDRGLLNSLHIGDHILVEINGQRVFTDNPIAAEQPWEVTETTDDSITISHPSGHAQRLLFSEILPSRDANNAPAVFCLKGTLPEVPVAYVILQLISHKSDLAGLHKSHYRWWFHPEIYTENFLDPIIKRGLLEQWSTFFKTFTERGWGYKSYKRFALRAGIKTNTIRAFINESWEEIDALPIEVLMNMARQLELLPTFLELSRPIPHDFCRTIEK